MNDIRGTLALLATAVLLTTGLAGCGDDGTSFPLQAVSERASPSVNNVIAYAAFGGTGQLFVFSIADDGSNNRLLTPLDSDDDIRNDGGFHPAWSPNAATIAFVRTDEGNNDIFTMTATGANVTALTDDPSSDMQPCYSPDGSKIAFVSNRLGTNDIFIMDADGSAETAVTSPSADDQWPCFDPTGEFIVYQSNEDESPDGVEDTDIWVIDLGTSVKTDLTDGIANASDQGGPSWSPDGTKILYHDDKAGSFDIWVMPVDASGQPTASPTQFGAMATPLSQGFPMWYPDGSRFAFLEARAIWTAAPDGTDLIQVTRALTQP